MSATLLYLFLLALTALVYSDCANPECGLNSGPCCSSDCTFLTTQCRGVANDCDKPEFCTGDSVDCPPDAAIQSETEVLWEWLGNSGQLRVWLPVCNSSASTKGVKIRFVSLEEIDTNGDGTGAVLRNLASGEFTTRILKGDNVTSDHFLYDPPPRDAAQIEGNFEVQGNPISLAITVFYFDSDSEVSWTASDNTTNSYDIPENSIKFNVAVEGEWPWKSTGNSLRLALDLLWPGGIAEVTSTPNLVSFDVSSPSLKATVAFPRGGDGPMVADDKHDEAVVSAENRGSHVIVHIDFPHFSQSAVYDPSVTLRSGAVKILNNFALGVCAIILALCTSW